MAFHSFFVISLLFLLLEGNSSLLGFFFLLFSLSASSSIFFFRLSLELVFQFECFLVNLLIPFLGMVNIVTFISIRYLLLVPYIVGVVLVGNLVITQLQIVISPWMVLMMVMLLSLALQLNKTHWILSFWEVFGIVLMTPSASHSHLQEALWLNVIQIFVNIIIT